MQKLILYGLNSLAKEIIRFSLSEPDYTVSYICVDQAYKVDSFCENIPIIAFEDLYTIDIENYKILITIGYTSMNELKEEKFVLCKQRGYPMTNFISSRACVYTNDIGESNIIMPHSVISNGVHLGNGNAIYPSAVIGHDCKIGSFNFIASCADILGKVTVGDRCFIGGNSTILDAKELADSTLVGAGAVVSTNTSRGQVVVPPRSVVLQKTSKEFF